MIWFDTEFPDEGYEFMCIEFSEFIALYTVVYTMAYNMNNASFCKIFYDK
jgi:hypothetical protein